MIAAPAARPAMHATALVLGLASRGANRGRGRRRDETARRRALAAVCACLEICVLELLEPAAGRVSL
jgi:hypothetical protein